MTDASDARFWDRASRKYAKARIADQGGYERTLTRTSALLGPSAQVLELGCGTGTTALRLAGAVKSYRATDISAAMIDIANEKLAATPVSALTFTSDTAESLAHQGLQFDTVLGFNYLHLVRDLPATLRRIRDLLAPDGVLISKTPCIGDMNPMIRLALLPAMRAIGMAPHVTVLRAAQLPGLIQAAGFDILAVENHATRGKDTRPFIVARRA